MWHDGFNGGWGMGSGMGLFGLLILVLLVLGVVALLKYIFSSRD